MTGAGERRGWFLEEGFVFASDLRVGGLEPVCEEISRLLRVWRRGVLHGVITSNVRDVTFRLQELMRSMVEGGSEVVFVDSAGLFLPEVFIDDGVLSGFHVGVDEELLVDDVVFPRGVYYTRPFQSLQFHQLLSVDLPRFLGEHERVRLVVVSELLHMFFGEQESQYDPLFPLGQVSRVMEGLWVLRQAALEHDVVVIVVLARDFLRVRDPCWRRGRGRSRVKGSVSEGCSGRRGVGFRGELREKFVPLLNVFQVMLSWDSNDVGRAVWLLKHFEREDGVRVLGLKERETRWFSEGRGVRQVLLDSFL